MIRLIEQIVAEAKAERDRLGNEPLGRETVLRQNTFDATQPIEEISGAYSRSSTRSGVESGNSSE